MIFAMVSLAVLFLFAVGITVAEFRSVPEGYEDETGFHFVWRNNTPETRDVVCIWKTVAEEDIVSDTEEVRRVA